jgi:sigma-B regulation protein RsbU (phosphoserine phosphatase)
MGLPKKILIAEDDPASCKILKTLVGKWDFDAVTASDGSEAWEIFKGDPDIHFILSDWMMPEVDGLELCKRVRSVRDRRYTYFILLTAKSQIEDVVSGLEAGADDFVTKPFNQYELRVRLRAGERVINLENELANKVEQLSKASKQMRRDLAAAATMQRGMLPPETGEFPCMIYSSRYIPSEEVGGDLFNLVKLDEKRLGVYILDVSGHGVPAALLSVAMGRMLSTYDLHASLLLTKDQPDRNSPIIPPREVADRLNQRFQSASSKGDFITFLYGVLDLEKCTFTYTRAGHPSPVVLSENTVQDINDKGDIPIGIVPQYEFGENVIKLKPGDRLFLFTDGLTEAANDERKRFSESRMFDHLEATAGIELEESVRSLVEKVLAWENKPTLSDDMSILGIEITCNCAD